LTNSWVLGGVRLFAWLSSSAMVINQLSFFLFLYLLLMAFSGGSTYSSSSPMVAFMRDMAS
jgi:hypothetical protein